MIEAVTVLTKGGLVLWSHSEAGMKGNPINTLIGSVLLEDRASEETFDTDDYTMRWLLDNELNLLFVIVYTKLLQNKFNIEQEILHRIRDSFIQRYRTELQQSNVSEKVPFSDFSSEYRNIVRIAESNALERKKDRRTGAELQMKQQFERVNRGNKPNVSGQPPPQVQVEHYLRMFRPDANATTDIYRDISERKENGMWTNIFSTLTNTRALTISDLEPVLAEFKRLLQSKNVASEIANDICTSVMNSLVGQKLGAFTAIKSVINKAMEEALTRILTPKRNIDILAEAMAAKENNRPYVITFCGVNGVGKSTSLSKICYWLLQNKFTVMLAAGDTYRSGAIEQLKVHGQCLGVEVFSRKYGTEPAKLAKEAITYAKKNNIDIVLIDTAGRMQGNDELMAKLAKLIQVNKPDLVLFVGEALVGNDGVDQLEKFNHALINMIALPKEDVIERERKGIDGIVLTKYDTIDDKVGATISMVYKTGHPILFVGVGQTYTDLRKLSVRSVVNALLN